MPTSNRSARHSPRALLRAGTLLWAAGASPAVLAAPIPVAGAEPISAVPPAASAEARDPAAPPIPPDDGESEVEEPLAPGPCPTTSGEVRAWIDRLRDGVYKTVCVSAYRFDSLFGGARADAERTETFGRVGVIALWDEKDRYDYDLRVRVKYQLPRMERRVDALFGRGTEDELIRGRDTQIDSLPDAFVETDAEWLAGLGYSPVRNPRNRVDFGVGVNISTPLEPYVNARYRRYLFLGDRSLMRFREILFWRSERGYGSTSRLDLDHVLTRATLARLATSATVSQFSEGVEWAVWPTLFQNLGRDRAIALQGEYRGATDAEVPVRGYGGRAILRHRVFREWLHLEARAGVLWRRDRRIEEREPTLELGFGFEIEFGEDGRQPPATPPGNDV